MGKKKIFFRGLIVLSFLIIGVSAGAYQTIARAYDVFLNDEVIAHVKDVQAVEELVDQYLKEQGNLIGGEVILESDLKFIEAKLDKQRLTDNIDKVFREKLSFQIEGFTLMIDEKAVLSMVNKEDLEKILEDYKAEYLKNIPEGSKIISSNFKQKVEITESNLDVKDVEDISQVKKILNTPGTEEENVFVEKGDNLSSIAKRNNISVDKILELNPEINPQLIRPGDKLIISATKKMLDVVINVEKKEIQAIPYNVKYENDNSINSGQRKVIEGKKGKKEVLLSMELENGNVVKSNIMEEKIILEPVTKIIKTGAKKTASRSGKNNYGVVNGARISSNYGWRTHPTLGTKKLHTGVDLAAPTGTSVYTYSSGKVIYAGPAGTYGNVIYIDHGNGLETRYAHLSKVYVTTGQTISVGQKIGAVGSTGRSTGPHLHFEVRKNGEPQSPWKYI